MIKKKPAVAGVNRITLSIMGDDYIVTGNDDPEYIRGIGKYLSDRLDALSQEVGGSVKLSKTQLAILVALQIADEFHRLQREQEDLMQLLREAK
ncbi:MAG TPA: cell division protein ZapA [Bacillota bacterium]|nr:cell division protein ZapA [Bacillota bacterium]